jgi:hypothetical protein
LFWSPWPKQWQHPNELYISSGMTICILYIHGGLITQMRPRNKDLRLSSMARRMEGEIWGIHWRGKHNSLKCGGSQYLGLGLLYITHYSYHLFITIR